MRTLALQWPLLIKQTRLSRTAVVGGVSLTFMVIAGSVYPAFGKQLTTAFSPLSLLFISEIMGGLFVIMSFGILPVVRKLKKLNHSQRIALISIGATTGVLAPYFWFKGLQVTTAVNAELFSRSEMIFMIILSLFVLQEKINKYQLFSLGVIVVGILCVALKGFTVGVIMGSGDLLIIASAVAYSFGGVYVKKYLHSIPPELIIAIRATCATVFFLCISPFVAQNIFSEIRLMPSELILALLAYGFIAKFLGIYSFHEAIDTLKVSTVSMFSTLSIVGGIVFAALYLGERIYLYHVIGAALIILGVLLMQRIGFHANHSVHEHHMRQHPRHNL